MTPEELSALQTEWDKLRTEVRVLAPRVVALQDSPEQDAIKAKMALLVKRQGEISMLFSNLLDDELTPQRDALEKKYFVAMGELHNTPLSLLSEACKQVAGLNRERVAIYREIRRCSRISGKAKPLFPQHAGIIHAGEITDSEKIKAAFLFGGQSNVGRGQMKSFGAQGV